MSMRAHVCMDKEYFVILRIQGNTKQIQDVLIPTIFIATAEVRVWMDSGDAVQLFLKVCPETCC